MRFTSAIVGGEGCSSTALVQNVDGRTAWTLLRGKNNSVQVKRALHRECWIRTHPLHPQLSTLQEFDHLIPPPAMVQPRNEFVSYSLYELRMQTKGGLKQSWFSHRVAGPRANLHFQRTSVGHQSHVCFYRKKGDVPGSCVNRSLGGLSVKKKKKKSTQQG